MVGREKVLRVLTAALLLVGSTSVMAVEQDQLDDFEDGSTAGWREGAPSPNPPTNIPTGGPAGAGDAYLENVSAGSFAGGRMVMFNTDQWAGDYITAGVRQIEADMANFGSTTLHIHFLLESSGGTVYGTSNPATLAPDGVWQPVVFELNDDSLVFVSGSEDLSTVLSQVSTVRILHSDSGPQWIPQTVAGRLGVDNVFASTVSVELQSFTVE